MKERSAPPAGADEARKVINNVPITMEAWRRLRQECLRIECETGRTCPLGDVLIRLAMTLPAINGSAKAENSRPAEPKSAKGIRAMAR